jgi:hypothetical protein
MFTSNDSDDFWSHDNCGCGYCDENSKTYDDGDEVYDDPYEVVMYDITTEDDDLAVLIDMLGDSARSWYAKRRINAMAAAGLSSLVAAVIIDSLGRRWDPLQHPRDRFGRFINTGGFLRWLGKGSSDWLRGQVTRIDSDGNIHVRAQGNDSIPDGTVYRFKPEFANKLVSTKGEKADLTPDFDADIPDFPEASDIQKQIYNHLGEGDMPASDLDRAVGNIDLSTEDFAGELQGLVERGLVDVDKSGDKPRARRGDNDDLGVVNVGDDELADVPDDDTPDLDDSPNFTKAQRDLLDRVIEADRGEGDGVGRDELEGVDDNDLQALIDAGALEDGEDGRLFPENPEAKADLTPDAAPESDISSQIFNASQEISDDIDVQEAFQHFAEELARPGDENNIPLTDGLPRAKVRNAEAAANKWWVDKNGTPDAEVAPEADAPEAEKVNPQDVLNPRNQAMADRSVESFFPDEEFLDGKNGIELRGAIKRLLDAEDLEANGFDTQAATERDKADRAMLRATVPEDEIPGWHEEVKAIHNGEREEIVNPDVAISEEDAPELPEEEVVPDVLEEPEIEEDELIPLSLPGDDFGDDEYAVDEDILDQREVDDFADSEPPEIAEEVVPEPEPEPAMGTWEEFSERVDVETANADFFGHVDKEQRIAQELELDLRDPDAPPSWEQLAEHMGYGPAELLYNDVDGDISRAESADLHSYADRFEKDLLDRFQADPTNPGPGVMRLRSLGLVEDNGNNGWQLTDAGRKRLGIEDELPSADLPETPDLDVDADVPEDAAPDVAELPDVIPDAEDDGPNVDFDKLDVWVEWTKRFNDERDLDGDLNDALVKEKALADELGIDLFAGDGLVNWNTFVQTVDPDVADELYREHDGSIGPATMDYIANRDKWDAKPAPATPDVDAEADVAPDVDAPAVEDEDVVPDADVPDTVAPTTSAPDLPDPSDPNAEHPGFKWTSGQGGFNAGGFYDVLEDNGHLKAGDKVYVKNGRSPEHAQNEALANRLYALSGVDVPELVLGSTGDRLVSKIIDGLRPLDIRNPDDAEVLDRVRDEFVIDAWIANWDGMNPGNTLVGPDNVPYRIDVGSAMEFRAQGGLKGSAFGDSVTDIDTLRDPSKNYDTAKVFGPMTDDEVAVSAARLAQINPDDIRSTIAASDLPDKDALADKMIARRESVLQRFGITDPFSGDGVTTVDDTIVDAVDTDSVDVAPVVRPTNDVIATKVLTGGAKAQKSRRDFASRTNPTLEVSYTNGGNLVVADGSELDFDTYYRSGAGGEAKIGKVVEVIDQERFPGWVKMEFLDGSEQIRHVLGVGAGKGGLRPAPEEAVEDWERQTSVTGDKATEAFDPNDFPMSDGSAPLVGTRIVFDVGGEDQYGTILYINPKWDKGGRAYIVPEGGGKVYEKPVRLIRAQTQAEIDTDASPLVPYQKQTAVAQYLPNPRFSQNGALLSRMDKPINIGDWMAQRSGGDGLVGEVIDIPDQNLWPGWVTLRFPDGEERSRHVEGFTDVGKTRGAGGLHHVTAPQDVASWTRQRRVKGEEGDVLSYDFSDLKTLDDTPIQVGQEVFGTDRRGAPVAGLLIRINPHMKKNGETVPTGFVWQDGREVTVDISKVTNTIPAASTTPAPRRVRSFTTPSTPSNVRTPTPSTPGTTPAARTPTIKPAISTHNTAPAYTPNKGVALTDAEIDGLDTTPSRVRTSDRTNGVDPTLAAIYEAQDFDALPLVVDQTEAERLVREEGYTPVLRSVYPGTDQRSGMEYTDAFRYGPYFAGNGIHGNGSYFAYGKRGLSESSQYGPRRIYALVRPTDLKTIDKWDITRMQTADLDAIEGALQNVDRNSDEYQNLKRRRGIYRDLGRYAAAKGYDAITVRHGNNNYDNGPFPDENLSDWGYLVLYNRSAAIAVDTYFRDVDDIFTKGFPEDLAPPAVEGVV